MITTLNGAAVSAGVVRHAPGRVTAEVTASWRDFLTGVPYLLIMRSPRRLGRVRTLVYRRLSRWLPWPVATVERWSMIVTEVHSDGRVYLQDETSWRSENWIAHEDARLYDHRNREGQWPEAPS